MKTTFRMITEKSFLLLRDELSKTVVEFEKTDHDYKTYYNNYENLSSYKLYLNKLHIDFVNEFRSNLLECKTSSEAQMYLVTTKRVFELIKVRLESCLKADYSGLNVRMISRSNHEITCINTGPEEFMQIEKYLHCQYETLREVIKVVKDCIENYSRSSKKKSSKKNRIDKNSRKDDFKDFYPIVMKLRSDLYKVNTLKEKMNLVQNNKDQMEEVFRKESRDFYNSRLNQFLENRLETYREILLTVEEPKKQNASPLVWRKTKTDFLELMNAIHQVKAVGLKAGDELSRKELIDRFTEFVNMEDIPDSDSRISKLQVRNTPHSFLLKLLETVERILIEK